MGTWHNADGLFLKFGTSETVRTKAGAYCMYGPECMIEVEVNLADLTATETIIADTVMVPDDALISKVVVITEVAAATGTAIDVGFIRADRTTELDYNGLLAAFPTDHMDLVGETYTFTQGHTIPASATGTGALIGEVMTLAGYISASRTDSTAFTAGRIRIQVYYLPKALASN